MNIRWALNRSLGPIYYQQTWCVQSHHSVAMLDALTLFSSSWMFCLALISASSADCSSRRADMSSLAKRLIFHGMSWQGPGDQPRQNESFIFIWYLFAVLWYLWCLTVPLAPRLVFLSPSSSSVIFVARAWRYPRASFSSLTLQRILNQSQDLCKL